MVFGLSFFAAFGICPKIAKTIPLSTCQQVLLYLEQWNKGKETSNGTGLLRPPIPFTISNPARGRDSKA